MDIHVTDAHVPPLKRKTDGNVRRTGTFSQAALIAHDKHFVFDPFHPLRDQPTAMSFLVLLAPFILIAYGTGPHVGAGIVTAIADDV
jgi:hypothetical protein